MAAGLRGQFPRLGDVDDIVLEAFVRVLQAREMQVIASPEGVTFRDGAQSRDRPAAPRKGGG